MPEVLLQLRPWGGFKGYKRAFDMAERAGFDGVEMDGSHIGPDCDRIQLLSLEHGLPIKSMIAQSPISYYLFDYTADHRAIEEVNPELLVFKVPKATVLGWPLKKLYIDQIKKYGEKFGRSKVAIENSCRSKMSIARPLFNLKRLRDLAYEHDISINFDVSDCAASGMDILLSCDMLIPRIRNIHFSDYGGHNTGGHIFPGFGLLPLGMLLSRLHEYKYDGLITLEIDQREMPYPEDDHVTLFSEMVGFIRSYF
ncbi:MAG TPA: TIM barrel protein [Methanocella sp.]|nr:TIM barrel protein [Methanocella sp.]